MLLTTLLRGAAIRWRHMKPPKGRAFTFSMAGVGAAYTYQEDTTTLDLPDALLSLPESPDLLSHSFLIRQTCISVIEAQSLFLTRVTTAIQDLSREYLMVLGEIASLTEDSVTTLTDAGGMRLAELQLQANDLRKTVNDQELLFKYVRKSVDSSVEMCFLTGAEFASAAVAEKMRVAEVEIEVLLGKIRMLEADVRRAHVSHIEKVGRATKIMEDRTDIENAETK